MSTFEPADRSAPWRVRSSRIVVDTPHLRLRSDTVELPDGTVVPDYFVRESRGYSVVFALTAEGEALLVRQYKHGAGREVLELPAGGIDPGEHPAACAARELAEETGYVGADPEPLGSFLTDPTGSDGRFHLFLVRDARRTREQRLDPTESIVVETAPPEALLEMVRDGRIDVAPHVTAVYAVFDRVRTGALRLR